MNDTLKEKTLPFWIASRYYTEIFPGSSIAGFTTEAFRTKRKYDRKAKKLAPKIMDPIGMAEFSPAIPTSGDEIEPRINGNNPNRADALPAICPCDSMASENDVVPIIPIDATKKKIGITTAINGAFSNNATRRMAPETFDMVRPITKKVFSDITSTNFPTA